MKISLLIVGLLLLSAPVGAQRPLEVIRVAVSEPTNADAYSHELADALRSELHKIPDLAFVSAKHADFDIRFAVGPIDRSSRCQGLSVAVLVVERASWLHNLSVYTGSDLAELVRYIVETINREDFAPRREAVLDRRK
jgi:hypothetical protein